jgi:hypothetical protein
MAVILANAGIQRLQAAETRHWIPAFAGMTANKLVFAR